MLSLYKMSGCDGAALRLAPWKPPAKSSQVSPTYWVEANTQCTLGNHTMEVAQPWSARAFGRFVTSLIPSPPFPPLRELYVSEKYTYVKPGDSTVYLVQ